MLREFANRDQLIAYLRQEFPNAAERDDCISEIVGGREAAEQALQKGRRVFTLIEMLPIVIE